MSHMTVSQQKGGLSRRSPAGRTFAFEFSRIRGIAPVLENEIRGLLDRYKDFGLVEKSGVSVEPDPLRVGRIKSINGETPVGILSYKMRMPGKDPRPLEMQITIYLGEDGSPIFQVNEEKFHNLNTAAILMSAAIRHFLFKT